MKAVTCEILESCYLGVVNAPDNLTNLLERALTKAARVTRINIGTDISVVIRTCVKDKTITIDVNVPPDLEVAVTEQSR